MVHTNGMHDFIMDEIELGTRVAHFQDIETYGDRLGTLSMEVEHWNCPTDYEEHERLHDCE